MPCHRESQWNFVCPTWSLRKVRRRPVFYMPFVAYPLFSHQRCSQDLVRPPRHGQDGIKLASIVLDEHLIITQIQTSKGEVIVTNDGATILKSIQALHPAAKMVCNYKSYPMASGFHQPLSLLIYPLLKILKLAMEPHLLLFWLEAF